MAELLEQTQNLESTTVDINRTSATVKGGRRLSFSALVVVGDRHGKVGIGYGKAPGVPAAIEKAQKDARKKLRPVRVKGRTIPHPVTGRFASSKVRLLPASPGTGVIAGGTVRAVLDMAGITDCLTKAYGSMKHANVCKAVMEGLEQLHTRDEVARLRGVEIDKSEVDEMLEAGERYMFQSTGEAKAEAPVNTVGKGRGGKRGSRGGRGERGERGGGGGNAGGGGRGADRQAGPDARGPQGGQGAEETAEKGGDTDNVGTAKEQISGDAPVAQPENEVPQPQATGDATGESSST